MSRVFENVLGGSTNGNLNFNDRNLSQQQQPLPPRLWKGKSPIQHVEEVLYAIAPQKGSFVPIRTLIDLEHRTIFYCISAALATALLMHTPGTSMPFSNAGVLQRMIHIGQIGLPQDGSRHFMIKVSTDEQDYRVRNREVDVHHAIQKSTAASNAVSPVLDVYGSYRLLDTTGQYLVAPFVLMRYYKDSMTLSRYKNRHGISQPLLDAYQFAVLELWRLGVALPSVDERDVLVVRGSRGTVHIKFVDLKQAVNLKKSHNFWTRLLRTLQMARLSNQPLNIAVIWRSADVQDAMRLRMKTFVRDKFQPTTRHASSFTDFELFEQLLRSNRQEPRRQGRISRLASTLTGGTRRRRPRTNDASSDDDSDDENNRLNARSRAPQRKKIRMRKMYPDDRKREQWKPRNYSIHWSMSQTKKERHALQARWDARREARSLPQTTNRGTTNNNGNNPRNGTQSPFQPQPPPQRNGTGTGTGTGTPVTAPPVGTGRTNAPSGNFKSTVPAPTPGVQPQSASAAQ
jgi:hypothetical protein